MLFSLTFVKKFITVVGVLGVIFAVGVTWWIPSFSTKERIIFTMVYIISIPLLFFVVFKIIEFLYKMFR
jgi:membrane associated rhomboid family serine protease